jgi:hypothetical protein
MTIALFATQAPGAATLRDNVDRSVVHLNLNPGSWAIFGKVAVANYDGDPQNAQVLLRTFGGVLIDRTAVHVPEDGCSDSIAVQGVFKADEDRRIEMLCATFKGNAQLGSLIAIQVDAAWRPQGSSPQSD